MIAIQPSGRLTDVHVRESDIADPGVGQCAVDVLRTIRIRPGPVGGAVTFAYPLVFAPEE